MPTIADRLFDSRIAECELEEALEEAGVKFTVLGWDDYDCSLEIHGVAADFRLSEAALAVVRAAGFITCFVNHEDKWETHYNRLQDDPMPTKGWRVSYPHKRGDKEGLWVEEVPVGWVGVVHCVIKAPSDKSTA